MSNIVIVDDNPSLLYALSEIFKSRGYSVRIASDGFSALAAIRDYVPDLLLSDLNMPGMSGFELLSVVRRRFPKIAVIAMSGVYRGVVVPPGIAADAFYAKGATSIARLFEILWAIEDRKTLESIRDTNVPVWIARLPIHIDNASTMAVACPECMRTYSHTLNHVSSAPEAISCPHCCYPVHLAVVPRSQEMDTTTIPLTPKASEIGEPPFASYLDVKSSWSECSSQ
ncbi:CheY-like chemotaxis protein [Granulicella mallensis]|uniref:CheY-like chemotaxis protein n=2 Tax=Granulicella mallensis TaxID=940614 RepID=A0A7W7ZQS9_9BACT|nr:CheY-like chemotaxis protein [Granulicella mallensis]